MNKHFEDTRYYLRRAKETAAEGLREELAPIEERFRELTSREEAPAPSRLETIREELKEIEARAEGEAKQALADARERLQEYRAQRAE